MSWGNNWTNFEHSDHAGMKNVLGKVSIFCLWTNWIHLVTCNRAILFTVALRWTKSVKFTLSIAFHPGGLAKHDFWACGDAKKRKKIAEHREYFWNMCPNPFSWAKDIKKWIQVKSRSASTCSLDDAFSEFMHVLGCLWCYFHRRKIHFVCNDDRRYFALSDLVFLLRLSWIVHTTLKGREVLLKTRLELAICPVISFKSRRNGFEWCWK